jgi:hypothetical protein
MKPDLTFQGRGERACLYDDAAVSSFLRGVEGAARLINKENDGEAVHERSPAAGAWAEL